MQMTLPARRINLLRRLPLFAECSHRELERIDALADEIEVAAGEVIVGEGDDGRDSFIVVSGRALVTLRAETLATLGPGSLFGDMAMIDGLPRSATVTALTPMTVLVIAPENFPAFLEEPASLPSGVPPG